jgi:hypothetical protein
MAKGHKTGGGSRKGVPNKASQDIQSAIRGGCDLVAKGLELLECGDKKVEAIAWRVLMEYGYGKPVQPISGPSGGAIPFTWVNDAVPRPQRP